MKSLIQSALIAVVLAASLTSPALASGIAAKLVIPDTTLLPGVPFEGWIEVENQAQETIAIGLSPYLLATDASGARFEARNEKDDYLVPGQEGELPAYFLELKSGERRTLPLPIRDLLTGPAVFDDARIAAPGKYTIAVKLDAWHTHEFPATPPATFAGPITTNEVTIERAVTTDADAQVWQRMQERANGHWTNGDWVLNAALGREIVTSYPTSNYVPYAIVAGAFGNTPERYLDLTLDAAARFPKSPVHEVLQWVASYVAPSIGKHEIGDREREKLRGTHRPTTRALAFGKEK